MELPTLDYSKYWDMGIQYTTEYGLKILAALLIFIIGKWAARRISDVISIAMKKAKVDETLEGFLSNIIYMLLMVVVVLAALNNLGVETTSFVAILASVGLAIGLALQGTLGNIGSGVMLIIFRPFKVGDFVSAGGESGTVETITLFATTMKTADNKVIIIPNASVAGGNITNFSAKPTRRVDFVFGIGYDDDLRAAKQTLENIVNADDRILKDPAPFVAVSELADSSVNFVVRVWVKSEDYWGVNFDTIEKVKLTFDEKGISIPYPQMDLHMQTGESQSSEN